MSLLVQPLRWRPRVRQIDQVADCLRWVFQRGVHPHAQLSEKAGQCCKLRWSCRSKQVLPRACLQIAGNGIFRAAVCLLL